MEGRGGSGLGCHLHRHFSTITFEVGSEGGAVSNDVEFKKMQRSM